MENARHLLLSVIFLSLHVEIKAAACPSFNPPMRTLLCPGDIITYTCALSSSFITINTQWTGSSGFQCSTLGSPVNTIVLTQTANASLNTVPVSCGNHSAVNTNISGTCYSSVLTIPTPQYFNGTTVMCKDGSTGALIGSDTLNIQLASSPGAPSNVQSSMMCTNSLTIQWTMSSSNNVAGYVVILTNIITGTTLLKSTTATMTTIGDLIDGTSYTVSVTAINCAGSSTSSSVSVQTLPCAPVSVSVTTVLYRQNNSVYDVELFWTHRQQSCSVPQYTVMVTSATSTYSNCTSSSCLYIFRMSGANVNSYNVSVACKNTLNQIGQPYVAMQSVPTPVLQVGQPNVSGNIATITCWFLNCQSFYCMVCCSTDPSVPPDSSVYNISTNRGTEVTVSIQGLTSGQMYYCKAAATNTNSNNYAGPVVGGMKVLFTFMTSYVPIIRSSTNPSTSSNTASIDTSTAVGISVAMTFILSFSLGGLVTAIIICGCYIPRRFSSKTTNSPVPTTATYEPVGINKKESNAIELESNSAYGTGKY